MITNIIILLQCLGIVTALFREIAGWVSLPGAMVRVPFRGCRFRAALLRFSAPLFLL